MSVEIEVNARRVVAFDVETTGTDPERDRIVELCLMSPGGRARVWRVNPGIPIPEAAARVHGIRDADVADAPPFASIAPQVQTLVDGATLLGYNSRTFDTLILNAELRRTGQPGIHLESCQELDVMRVWASLEPRSLSGAVRRFLGHPHEGAHGARADTAATLAVWEAMRALHGLSLEDGVRLTRPENEIDRHGRFAIDGEGRVVYNFGKHQGTPVANVDPGYLEWMAKSDFPPSTKAVIERLILNKGDLPEAAALRARRVVVQQ